MSKYHRFGLLLIALAAASVPAIAQTPHAKRIAYKPAVHRSVPAAGLDPEIRAAMDRAPKATQWPNEDYASVLDTADITVKPDGTTVAEYRLAFKLFNERARDLAEVSLPYNDGYQQVEVISARTIRKNGTILPVGRDDIRTQSPYSEYLMYDDSKTLGFSMPGIEDDCIIDYRWRITTKPFIAGHFSESWTFSEVYPVSVSRVALHVPAAKQFNYRVYNNPKLQPTVTQSPDGKTKTMVWEMREIPPIDQEPDMPEMADVDCWMEISSLKDWQEMARWYDGLMKPQTVATAALRKTVQELTAGKKTDEEKARALYDFAANRVRYVGLEFGISAFKPHAAASVHDKLYGDCKDKATLLITMLGLAGIKAHPALLTAETLRPVRNQLPTLEAFNHCIAVAEIGGKEVWLDATAETCAFGDIPDSDRGSDALVIKDGGGQFRTIPTYSEADNSIQSANVIALNPDRSGQMDINITFTGATAQEWRGYARQLTPDRRRQLVTRMVPAGGALKSYTMPDGIDKNGPYVVQLKLDMKRLARKTGNLLLLGMPAVIGSSQRNPFSKDARIWPVVNRQSSETRSVTTVAIPDGYVVEDLPEPVQIDGPLATYRYQAVKSTDGKTVTVTVERITRAGVVLPADYEKIKAYYDKVIEAQDDQLIVLRKAA
jgi:hypothetical protein